MQKTNKIYVINPESLFLAHFSFVAAFGIFLQKLKYGLISGREKVKSMSHLLIEFSSLSIIG